MEILTKQISFPVWLVIFYFVVFMLILVEIIKLSVQKMFSKADSRNFRDYEIPFFKETRNNKQFDDLMDILVNKNMEDNKKCKPLYGRTFTLCKSEYPELYDIFNKHGMFRLAGYDLIWE